MSAFIELRGQLTPVDPGHTVAEALHQLALDPESYLMLLNGKLVEAVTLLQEGDHLQLIPAIAGG